MTTLHIAILGAGPTGLEAALAAVDSGCSFTLYEASSRVAGNVRDWGHVQLFSPWGLDVSARMRAHLAAHGHDLPSADSDECPTGDELAARVLEPLAALPEIAPHLRLGVRVLGVSREGMLKHDEIGGNRRQRRFRLLLGDRAGREWVEHADAVLDCTGTWGHPNAVGSGGIAAPGESSLPPELICRRIPDLERERQEWSGKTVLLVGAGHSAQTAVRDLAALAEKAPGTRVIWALRSSRPDWRIDLDDPLPQRSLLGERARALAEGASPAVETVPGVVVDELTERDGKVVATLRRVDGDVMRVEADRVLALTGAVGDHRLYRQLQVHECYATAGPMKLAAALLGAGGDDDCLAQESHGADSLVNPEPGFFILGSKSYGRNNTFLMRVGWQQVEEVFGLLAPAAAVAR